MKPNHFHLACLSVLLAAVAPAAQPKPNVVIILADDMGFSDAGCYGGEIHTPNLDNLAANGLRFTQFYNTARCWPTRAAILTGYYPQQVRMDPPAGRLPAWAHVLPHYLKPLGYRSYHVGKWHLSAAPRPVADGGFDRSYWLEDTDRHFSPLRHSENDRRLPPVEPGSGYYSTTAMADHALAYLKDHARNYRGQPFFLYLAFISPHFPLHAPAEDVARYRDTYQAGWDTIRERRWQRLKALGLVNCGLAPLDQTLSPRYFKTNVLEQLGPGECRYAVPWETLSETQKKFQAAKMAVHAAMVDRIDQEIGRVLDQLRAMKALDDTLILFLSDNGADASLIVRGDGHEQAAAPGTSKSFLCIGPGWASASNTPFRRHKVWVSEGGISTPLIAHWPRGIRARGELRHEVGHVIDFLPTLIDVAGGHLPQAGPGGPALPGRSLVPAFARDGAVTRGELFFDHEGNHALRMGDWKLVSAREDMNVWELFDLSRDRCEKVNLAAQQPERLNRMQARWTELETEFRRHAAAPATPAGKKQTESQPSK